ncbi:hypothetical protein SUGI_0880940 [Cryptomeria japonica]|uniref:proline dehydrogenase 2, mitochondrial n=1 Tax=Cryptomeria japonica TaxID=3369 RepID=UPI00241474BD|nr:proline dehydrogenase 2, mitochondrial [Cryptomeria japonica]GLJ42502.1 hypothetical protein SUGI_0880940 [Cryptomeria japonica]
MAWRALLASSKGNRNILLGGLRNRFERSEVRVSASFVGNSEVCGSKLGGDTSQGLFNSRCLTSESAQRSAPALQDWIGATVVPDIINHGNLQIENGEALYSAMSSRELLSTLFNLYLVAYEPLVDLSIKVLRLPLMKHAAFRIPVLQAVKQTAYSHFCAGENVAEASATLQRMWELGLKGILDYSLEDATDNDSCDQNLQGFLNTVQTTLRLPAGSVSFACVKITALCPLPLLERVSDLLRWRHLHPDQISLPWMQDTLPILAPSSPTYHTFTAPEPLTATEEKHLKLAEERLRTLCKSCEENSLPLLIDAEYTSVQPAIDYFTFSASLEFNKSAKPVVYGTVQAYLQDALPRLQLASDEATRRGIQIGLKLVRGAYISRESALAASLGAPSPIHSSIQDTHNCYDACASLMMEKAAMAEASVVLATHNFQSGKAAAAKAEELNIRKGNDRVQFAQLKGMADSLSLGLVQAGFQVSKYLPFGPVDHVMPYLIRRAEENRGLLSTTTADRQRISKELSRRLQAVIVG